jgi:hypothetical protein
MFIKIEVGRGTFSMRDVCHEIHRRHKRIHFQIDHLAETDDDDILSKHAIQHQLDPPPH